MASARLTFCGAARGVTGSCYHLAVDGAELVIDCGVFQGGPEDEALNARAFPFDPAKLSAVVLTHGHLDHCGRLPRMAERLAAPVIGHAATLEVARLIMEDSAKIAQHSRGEPLYDAAAVAEIAKRLQPAAGYGKPVQAGPFTIELFDAGHIIGSSSVRVSWGERAILFSGDLGALGQPIIRDPNRTWEAGQAVDWVVTESTYGDKLHPSREEARATFREVVRRALADGGKVLVPAFSIGRTQDVIYELNGMLERGELAGKIPVVLDGPLGTSTTKIYERHKECWDAEALALLQRGDPPLELDHLTSARDAAASKRAVGIDGPAIIIAGSGMCQGGRIRHHLEAHLPDPRTDVVLVGYQAVRTLGRALRDGASEVHIGRATVPVRARITTIPGFSAHGDRDALLAWHDALPRRPGATTFVTHGEEDVSLAYARTLGERGVAAHVPALFESVDLA
jgi:metallo-beta-lactamase family protein